MSITHREELWEKLSYAVERVISAHEPLDHDSRCSCGARNNMDGDVLHSHRVSLIDDAILDILDGYDVRRRP